MSSPLVNNTPATIEKGFQIDEPRVLIEWKVTKDEVLQILSGTEVRKVTDDYFTFSCLVFGDLNILLGLHFDEDTQALYKFEIFRDSYPDQRASYDEFQRYLEEAFGLPPVSTGGGDGFPDNEWTFGDIKVFHYIANRFGPEEHVHIERMEEI